jgi:hypothetical protein
MGGWNQAEQGFLVFYANKQLKQPERECYFLHQIPTLRISTLWLRRYATNRKDAVSRPVEANDFYQFT